MTHFRQRFIALWHHESQPLQCQGLGTTGIVASASDEQGIVEMIVPMFGPDIVAP